MPEHLWQWFGEPSSRSQFRALAELFAATPWPLLLLGERGTGKTALAREMHALSRRFGAFVKQPALGLGADTAIAELQGHVAGAFTGATGSRGGLIQAAKDGTFFLDEIGIAPPALQGLFLQLLEDRDVRLMGSERTRPLNVRFIAATNEDLPAAIEGGRFRADLLDRFGEFRLEVPPLRDRRDEIIGLALLFIQRAAATLKRSPPQLDPGAARMLTNAAWPGNVRDLESACRYAVLMTPGGERITPGRLPGSLQEEPGRLTPALVREWIAAAGGNLARAARAHGYTERHLRRVLGEVKPDPPSSADPDIA